MDQQETRLPSGTCRAFLRQMGQRCTGWYEIAIEDDGLVRQLISVPQVSPEIIEDNRLNRNVPIEMSVTFIGWERGGILSQTRVPHPPLTLDEIFACEAEELPLPPPAGALVTCVPCRVMRICPRPTW